VNEGRCEWCKWGACSLTAPRDAFRRTGNCSQYDSCNSCLYNDGFSCESDVNSVAAGLVIATIVSSCGLMAGLGFCVVCIPMWVVEGVKDAADDQADALGSPGAAFAVVPTAPAVDATGVELTSSRSGAPPGAMQVPADAIRIGSDGMAYVLVQTSGQSPPMAVPVGRPVAPGSPEATAVVAAYAPPPPAGVAVAVASPAPAPHTDA
jgi:hypothetical protein